MQLTLGFLKRFSLATLSLFFIFSCNDSSSSAYKAESSGNLNRLNVVITNEQWQDSIGEKIRGIFAADAIGLPQQEPKYALNQIPPEAFNGFARRNRTFFKIEQSKQTGHQILLDSFAEPQTGIIVTGPNSTAIITELENHKSKFLDVFEKSELKEKRRRMQKSPKEVGVIEKSLGINMLFPSAYRYAKQEDDFFWMRKDIKNGSMELLAYEVPLSTIEKNGDIIANVVKMRDSVGAKHIPGPKEGTHMITEEAYAPYLFETEIDGKFAYEVKGTWEVKDFFMAGPFVTYAIKDVENDRYVILEGSVFKPSSSKRLQMFEIESILKSAEFVAE
ncbi:DUF4837 family protein [Psychroflexus sediminis]|uniref:DUF4837 domain-containing protein n=1 Tax=Psychroflexus sediminis TaxID=470826 RepID=A0A1G7UTK2_9FLAO|nr:DUF4837 family protein [Psychroflexus sediminis]SDG50817.1 protein of unknown function [Psychroflexus sediminis]